MRETFVVREDEMKELAERVLSLLKERNTGMAKVVHLEGDLGAGKTTFTKELAQSLGIDKEEVHSPTFILKKEYRSSHPYFRRLVHVDAYRFDDESEGDVLELERDKENRESIIAVEWPSRMRKTTPDMHLQFTVVNDDTREVTITY